MSHEYSHLEKICLQKLEQFNEQGIDAYPNRAERTHTNLQAVNQFEIAEKTGRQDEISAVLVGRLRSMRTMGKITFAHIEDGSGRVQLFLRENDLGAEQLEFFNHQLDLGDFIEVAGVMFRTRSGETTLRVRSFRLLAKSITPLPAAKDQVVDGEVVRHALLSEPEARYRQRYADLAVNPDVRQIFKHALR